MCLPGLSLFQDRDADAGASPRQIYAAQEVLEVRLVPQTVPIPTYTKMDQRGLVLLAGPLQPFQGTLFVSGMGIQPCNPQRWNVSLLSADRQHLGRALHGLTIAGRCKTTVKSLRNFMVTQQTKEILCFD